MTHLRTIKFAEEPNLADLIEGHAAALMKEFPPRATPKPKPADQAAKMRNLIGIIASMKKDGEGDFVMENDDAVDTVNSLIGQARELLHGSSEGAAA